MRSLTLQSSALTATVLGVALATSLGAARDARACGGTFCDSGPQQMSVDQKGENILFVSDGQSIEAHIQIQYDGHDAARFAWIIPVQAMPTSIGIGSERLFANVLQGTVPTYGFQSTNACPTQNCQGSQALGAGGSATSGGSAGSSATGGSGGGGPVVTYQATVGAFDVVVLQGGTADEVMTWLDDNQFQQIPAAKAIIEDYLSSGHLFVAVKMTNGAGVDEIHPLVIRYPGQQPCIPLKLTAVAAVEDMGVRAFFLGDGRWVPTNYKHMVLNEAQVDWIAFAQNYDTVVSKGADSPVNDGHAFTTEYAGPSYVIPAYGLWSSQWNPKPFVTIAPEAVVDTLAQQGLATCQIGVGCTYGHPLIEGLLHAYLPVPAGVTESAFYGCLSCYKAKIDATKWDGPAFSQDFIARVIEPGARAQQILQANPYVTRLFTTISPGEMTVDPEFHQRADLPTSAAVETATRRLACSVTGMELPDGRTVGLENGQWPVWDDSMPWVERVEQIPLTGAPVVLVDNKAKIDAAVAAQNAKVGWPPPPPPPPPPCPTYLGGGGGTAKGGSSTTGGGAGQSAGGASAASEGGASAAARGDEPSGGCSSSGKGNAGVGTAGLALALAALFRRARAGGRRAT